MRETDMFVIGIACLMLLLPASLPAAVIEVKGLDSSSLATAIQQAGSGDTVHLGEGVYELTEPLRPKSNLKIIGAVTTRHV